MDQATAQEHLDLWLAADQAIAVGKAYTIGNRQLTRADAAEVAGKITYWQRQVNGYIAKANGAQSGFKVPRWNY